MARFTAHPKRDPETGELVWFAYSVGEQPMNALLDHGVTARERRLTRGAGTGLAPRASPAPASRCRSAPRAYAASLTA
jgi:hypothetical protein